jgi:hypothetical protein
LTRQNQGGKKPGTLRRNNRDVQARQRRDRQQAAEAQTSLAAFGKDDGGNDKKYGGEGERIYAGAIPNVDPDGARWTEQRGGIVSLNTQPAEYPTTQAIIWPNPESGSEQKDQKAQNYNIYDDGLQRVYQLQEYVSFSLIAALLRAIYPKRASRL